MSKETVDDVIDRCSLTILEQRGQEDPDYLLTMHQVEVNTSK